MNNELGNTIKKNRIRLGMSQTDLSKITGVDTKTISLIERGIRRKPTPETLIKLASVLDCIDIRLMYLAGYEQKDISETCRILEDDRYEYAYIVILKGHGVTYAGDVEEAKEYAKEDIDESITPITELKDEYGEIIPDDNYYIITDFGNQK